ncbi:uncharacterized protein LOC111519421 [Drosophila willistoni]|uniref:uncharacterized protein LOC111519421 n=1 Tax=Drosophila willistoni TaxID=7260 RepID=UPI000C26C877|nr:uncharacterized protein LOC111519421 [Drosophila willistoni]
MDLHKAEKQHLPIEVPAPASRERSVERLKHLVQDLLCFLVLFMIALLVVSAVFFVIDDWRHLQQASHRRRSALKVQSPNAFVASSKSESIDSLQLDEQIRQIVPQWGRALFHCYRVGKSRGPSDLSTEQPMERVLNATVMKNSTEETTTKQGELEKMNEVTNTRKDKDKLYNFLDYINRAT